MTRRVSEGQFRLRPSRDVNELLLYCLAHTAERNCVDVNAFVFMSNHEHLIVTDPEGRLPEFCHDLHLLIARALNCYHGEEENLWAPGSYSAVRLISPEDTLDKYEYLCLNPVAAELVERSSLWPGLVSSPADLRGKIFTATRPEFFFSSRTDCPPEVSLQIKCPPCLADRPLSSVISELEDRIAFRESIVKERVNRHGRTFLGVKGVLAQSPFRKPAGKLPRGGLNPTVAAKDVWRRIEALDQLLSFRLAYRDCRDRFRRGEREVKFPYGTYGPRVLYGARVHAAVPG